MLRRDRRGNIRPGTFDELHRFARGDVFEHHFQLGQVANQRGQGALDEHGLAVENIDMGVGHFAMDQQRHPDLRHAFQHAANVGNRGHPVGRPGGGMGGIELGGDEHPFGKAARHLVRIGGIGQVERHQRGEIHPRRQCRHDPLAIGCHPGAVGHRRGEVGHDDRPGKLARGMRQHPGQHRAVAQMDMPVVGAADGQAIRHGAAMP